MKIRVLFTFLVSVVSIGAINAQEEPEKLILPPSCALVLCAKPDCDDFFTPPDQCCPICRPDCLAVICESLECEEGEILVTPPGECCAVCQTDCSAVSCAKPLCKAGETLETPPGQCCPECTKPDCSLVLCLKPECDEGETIEIPPGQCCPRCRPTRPDCAAVLCRLLTEEDCDVGEVLVTPPGECCARCQRDCSAVSCVKPECGEDQTTQVPDGECCPVCVDSCPFEGQEFSFCPGCDSTCTDVINEEIRFCPAVCRPGCGCPGGELIDTIAGRCVPKGECTNPCALIDCLPGFSCKVNRTTDKPFCDEVCDPESCVKPVCEEGGVLEVPPGGCCPVCTRPDCAAVLCLAITEEDCNEGEQLVIPPGECCAVCQPDCSAVSCVIARCDIGHMLEVPEGECCPICVNSCPYKGQQYSLCPGCDATCIDIINQEARPCLAVCRSGCGCPGGELIDTIAGRCVPRGECTNPCALIDCLPGFSCKVNRTTNLPFCDEVCDPESCVKPVCEEGGVLEVPPGGCCPVCTRPDCAAVLCQALTEEDCDEGEVLVTPPGECCARCQRDCSAVSCLKPTCEEGQTLQVPDGECCPVCIESCPFEGQEFSSCPGCDSTCIDVINEEIRLCPTVCRPGCGCQGGQLIDTIVGRCVPSGKCTNPCATVECSPGSRCRVSRETNLPFCTPPSCDVDNGGCSKDELCRERAVLCVTTPCIPQIECLSREVVCSLEPDVGPCEGLFPRFFHNATSGQCEPFTYGGCDGNANNFETIRECRRDCGVRDPCATVRCRRGHRCEVFKPTGEAFCTPDCSLDNGGCSSAELCTLNQVQCVRAPCPPVVQCLSRCAAVRCRAGHQCEIFEPTGEPFCAPNCSLGNGGCAEHEICTLEDVQCIRAPCPPVVNCLSPCAAVRCPGFQRCEVYEPTGEPFCTPDCSLGNGGCAEHEICTLEDVQCIRAPCPPVVNCLSPCAAVRCPGFQRCEVYEPTGEPFCTPDCSIGNGGCSPNEICTLQDVLCVRAPCPPVVQCLSTNPCAAIFCGPGHRCEVDPATGQGFCNPDCSLNNGGCRSDQICELKPIKCIRSPCPPEVQCSCPPPCSKEFCLRNPRGLCSNPGPREFPGCTGACQLTFCKACFYSRDEVTVPDNIDTCPVCSDPADYSRPSRCYWRWSRCAGHRYWRANRPDRSQGEFATEFIRCPTPPCPFRG